MTLLQPYGDARKQSFKEACRTSAVATREVKVLCTFSLSFGVDCIVAIHDLKDDAHRLLTGNGETFFFFIQLLFFSCAVLCSLALFFSLVPFRLFF